MKTLKELGISPAPWKNHVGSFAEDANGFLIEIDEGCALMLGDTPNARLVIVSPELLTALQNLVDACGDDDKNRLNEALLAAKSVIGKVNG